MRLSTALRIAGIVVVAKAVLIGVVYWRRAELVGRPIDAGTAIIVALVAVVVIAAAIATAVRIAKRS